MQGNSGRATPGVGVIIAARNAADTIQRAVRSALAEPEAAEVIVVDDGSTDATAALAQACDDRTGRLRVISQAASGSPGAARNTGLAVSRAEWVCPLDSDDFFLPGRLSRILAQSEGCELIADDLWLTPEGAEDAPPKPLIGDEQAFPFEVSLEDLIHSNVSRRTKGRRELGYLKPLIRREFLVKHGLAYDPTLRLGEDFILYGTALAKGARFRVVAAAGYVYVQRPGSISHEHGVPELRALKRASGRFEGLPELSGRAAALARRHTRHVADKLQLREVLQAKREGGLRAGLAALLRRPGGIPYVLDQWRKRPPKAARKPEAVRPRPTPRAPAPQASAGAPAG